MAQKICLEQTTALWSKNLQRQGILEYERNFEELVRCAMEGRNLRGPARFASPKCEGSRWPKGYCCDRCDGA